PIFEYKFAWQRVILDITAARINYELICEYLRGAKFTDQPPTVAGFDKPEDFKDRFMSWLVGECGFNPIKDRVNLAGKNPSFDHAFLKTLGITCCRHRHIDPAHYFVDWAKDEAIPGLSDCLKRAGITGLTLHTAKDDAMAIVLLMRSYLGKHSEALRVVVPEVQR